MNIKATQGRDFNGCYIAKQKTLIRPLGIKPPNTPRMWYNQTMKKILFLCHGNICRSPMAEFVMKKLLSDAGRDDIIVESAALHTDEIGSDTHFRTRRKLQEMGIPFTPRAAWLLTAAKASEYDLLIGMDAYNLADLRRLVHPKDLTKIHSLLSFAGSERPIADPWYTGNFDDTWNDVLEGCTALLKSL